MAVLFIGHYFGYYNMGPWVCLKTGHPKTHWWQFSYHFPLEIVFAGRRSPIFHKMPHSRHETCDCQTFWDHDAGRKSTPLEAVGQSEANISWFFGNPGCKQEHECHDTPRRSSIVASHSMGGLEMGVPQIIHFNGFFPYKPSILGYHHLWTPPYWPSKLS